MSTVFCVLCAVCCVLWTVGTRMAWHGMALSLRQGTRGTTPRPARRRDPGLGGRKRANLRCVPEPGHATCVDGGSANETLLCSSSPNNACR